MKFSLFDVVHWPYGDSPEDYDPKLAVQVYKNHLEEWVRAEELGFDGVYMAEHHFGPYNLTPSPNLMVAALSQRTKRMTLGIMINVLPFHEPLRLAEEAAMLDLLTEGRLVFGLGRGVDEQEIKKMEVPFAEMRPRFEEGLELMLNLWQNQDVEHHGRFYHHGKATIWPRPLQRPYPPILIAALSDPTIEWAGRNGYPMGSAFLPASITAQRFALYRRAAAEAGRTVTPDHTIQMRNVYVADTDEQAWAEAEGPLVHLFKLFIPHATFRDPNNIPEDYAYYREFFAPFVSGPPMTFQDVLGAGILIAGSPDTVARMINEQIAETGAGHLMGWMNFGNLTPEQVRHSEELFATKVIPQIKSGVAVPA